MGNLLDFWSGDYGRDSLAHRITEICSIIDGTSEWMREMHADGKGGKAILVAERCMHCGYFDAGSVRASYGIKHHIRMLGSSCPKCGSAQVEELKEHYPYIQIDKSNL